MVPAMRDSWVSCGAIIPPPILRPVLMLSQAKKVEMIPQMTPPKVQKSRGERAMPAPVEVAPVEKTRMMAATTFKVSCDQKESQPMLRRAVPAASMS